MKEERATNINELEEIIKAHYGYKSVSIKRIWGGTTIDNMTGIGLGPGGVLDMLLEVDDGEEDDKNKEVFSFNAVDRIGKRMAKQTERIDVLEWHIKNIEKHLVELRKEIIKQGPVKIHPSSELKLVCNLT